ncbi:excinuclease ABC subunit A [Algicella marina]|uniref:Excinuclease ABC subunit A n=1 Tax=Algicella marina TaxID=2683284 RepID=A0A6P1T1W3_9RHOB|nr:excinuclease ABC subunit A [Algicella marina]QHQ34522.1 excinuclease ABC subunit A [Algicella marina]
MFRTLAIASLLAATSLTPAMADNNRHCPPGLAKKSPACVPPGQAKKWHRDDDDRRHTRYHRGDRYDDDVIFIRDPERYGLRRGESYIRSGDYVFRVNRETREVLDLIGAVSAILN